MNIYRFRFETGCPNNDERVVYNAEIQSREMIMVESIAQYFKGFTSAFHEDIADSAYRRFGGHQVIRAHHHGVDVETRRGEG